MKYYSEDEVKRKRPDIYYWIMAIYVVLVTVYVILIFWEVIPPIDLLNIFNWFTDLEGEEIRTIINSFITVITLFSIPILINTIYDLIEIFRAKPKIESREE
jgi:hypothetical protein